MEMLFNNLKILILTFIYIGIQFIILFVVNYHYSDVITYYLYGKWLPLNSLYAIKYYEIIGTNLLLATIFSFFITLSLAFLHILFYAIPGIYHYEMKLVKSFSKGIIMVLAEISLFIYLLIPIIFGHTLGNYLSKDITSFVNSKSEYTELAPVEMSGEEIQIIYPSPTVTSFNGPLLPSGPKESLTTNWMDHKFYTDTLGDIIYNYKSVIFGQDSELENWNKKIDSLSIIQIFSYENVTKIILTVILLWVIISIIFKVSDGLYKKRKYLPLFLLIIGIFILPPDLLLQSTLTAIIFIRLELSIFFKFWSKNKAARTSELHLK